MYLITELAFTEPTPSTEMRSQVNDKAPREEKILSTKQPMSTFIN